MSGYDVAAGADQTALNTVASSIYTGVYPKVFKGTINVGEMGIASVSYDIQAAPTFSLSPSALVRAARAPRIQAAFSGDRLAAELDGAAQATFNITFSKVALVINYSAPTPPTQVSGSLVGGGQVQVNSDSTLSLSMLTGTITIPNEPTLSDLLNKAAIPLLIAYLNQQIFTPIAIPALSFSGVTLSLPVVLTQNGTLLAFSSMGSPVTPPGPGTWISGKGFIAADAPLLNAVTNSVIGNIGPKGSWHWSCDVGVCDLSLDANYSVVLSNAQFNLSPNPGSSVTGTVTVQASAGFSGSCGFFSPSFSATATATPTATASVSAVGSNVMVTFQSLDAISFDFNFSGVPWYIPDFVLNLLANAFAPIIASAVTSALSGTSFKVYQIPTIQVAIASIPFNIVLTQLAASTIASPDSVPLLTVAGLAQVTSPSVAATVRAESIKRVAAASGR